MMFLNSMEVEHLAERFGHGTADYPLAGSPVHGKACRFLKTFMDEVNANSDGWAHWAAPLKAAKRLMDLVQNSALATEANYKAALTPIKRFYTLRGTKAGMKWPEVDGPKGVTLATLRKQRISLTPNMLYCPECGATFSATPGDYFMRDEDEVFTHCGVPNKLVTKKTTYVEVPLD